MIKRPNRPKIIGGIVIAVIILLTLIAAPSSSKLSSGSTYNRAPEGYGAWYNFMQERGTKIERWQRPFKELIEEKSPATLLLIYPSLQKENGFNYEQQQWVEKGNTLVVLGVSDRTTNANFSTMLKSSVGDIKIDTSRRRKQTDKANLLLKDAFGAVVWQETYGKGKVIYSTTPHLAANAYQDNRANFEYLTQLVSNKGNKLFIDEYLHGYKDANIKKAKGEGDIYTYFIQKPIFVSAIQAIVLLIVLILAQNRRFGKPILIETPKVNNSEAYIQALAAVLQKADSTDFVLEMVGKEEIQQMQEALGLGKTGNINVQISDEVLLPAWQDKIGTSTSDLKSVLQMRMQKRRISEKDLIAWLSKWQSLRKLVTKEK
jgi:Domain of unknown function (DUF4350)